VPGEKNKNNNNEIHNTSDITSEKSTEFMNMDGMVKFEVYGREMIEKRVKLSGNSGRVYLPPDWVNHRVKIIRID
jgi:putative transposon-encoded protein